MSIEEIKKVLHYNPDTGIFTRLDLNRETGSKTWQGYLSGFVLGKAYLLHRLAVEYMTGFPPENQVDHINGVRTDNRWINLRCVTSQQNKFNRSHNLNRELKIKNVYWIPKIQSYRVKMKVNGITKHYGYFKDLDAAIIKSKEVQIINHGDYAPSHSI